MFRCAICHLRFEGIQWHLSFLWSWCCAQKAMQRMGDVYSVTGTCLGGLLLSIHGLSSLFLPQCLSQLKSDRTGHFAVSPFAPLLSFLCNHPHSGQPLHRAWGAMTAFEYVLIPGWRNLGVVPCPLLSTLWWPHHAGPVNCFPKTSSKNRPTFSQL